MSRTLTILASCAALPLLAGCTTTPDQPEGGVESACASVPPPPGAGLTLGCEIEGTPENALVNPTDPTDSSCSLLSFTLFEQELTATATLLYGEGNQDSDVDVRVGAIIDSGQHSGRMAKSSGADCLQTLPPAVQVTTNFGGRHTAFMDKEASPWCVYTSQLELSSFEQNVGVGIEVDVGLATQAATETTIARQMDFEIARAVNGIMQPNAVITAAFEARAGRCAGDYQPITGP